MDVFIHALFIPHQGPNKTDGTKTGTILYNLGINFYGAHNMPESTHTGTKTMGDSRRSTVTGNPPHLTAETGEKLIPFLSYAKSNKNVVREFAARLKSTGWIDPWYDEEDILPGQVWQESVVHAVRHSHAVIIFLSKVAVASEGFFQKELTLALDTAAEKPEGTIFIIPIRLNDCEVPSRLQQYQYVNYYGSDPHKEIVYISLIAALRKRAESLGIKII
jgi:hypothetical protein